VHMSSRLVDPIYRQNQSRTPKNYLLQQTPKLKHGRTHFKLLSRREETEREGGRESGYGSAKGGGGRGAY